MSVKKVGEVIKESAAEFVDLKCVARDQYKAEAEERKAPTKENEKGELVASLEVTICGLVDKKVQLGDVLTGLRRVDADRVAAKYNENRNQTNPLKMVITGLSKDQGAAASANDKKQAAAIAKAEAETARKAVEKAETNLKDAEILLKDAKNDKEKAEAGEAVIGAKAVLKAAKEAAEPTGK